VLKTHLEKVLESVAGPYFEEAFRWIRAVDSGLELVQEDLFDKMFNSQFFSKVTGTPVPTHETRLQRKLDLSVITQMYHLWRDKNYFDLSPRLCDKLLDTDLRDLDTFFLRTPYKSMYLSLPKGNGMHVHSDVTGAHELVGIYIMCNDLENPQDIGIKSTGGIVQGVTKYMHILACGEDKGTEDSLVFFDLLFWEGKISDSIARNKIYLPNNPKLWPEIEEIFSFVVKVLLYLNCANISIQQMAGLNLESKLNGLKNPAKKRKLLKRYAKQSLREHKLLDIVVNHSQERNQDPDHERESTGKSKNLERVRGHFKGQRFGKGYSESKVIWVEPYIRGSDACYFRDSRRYKVI
jgi:hypothetical protein